MAIERPSPSGNDPGQQRRPLDHRTLDMCGTSHSPSSSAVRAIETASVRIVAAEERERQRHDRSGDDDDGDRRPARGGSVSSVDDPQRKGGTDVLMLLPSPRAAIKKMVI